MLVKGRLKNREPFLSYLVHSQTAKCLKWIITLLITYISDIDFLKKQWYNSVSTSNSNII